MPDADDILWFKQRFHPEMEAAVLRYPVQPRHADGSRLPGDRLHLASPA
jgi:hypothetical protein